MATNQEYTPGNRLSLPCTQPATPESGDPVLVGQLPGVALVNEAAGGNPANHTSIQTDGVWNFNSEAVNNAGNSAIAVGDIAYYDAAAVIKINKDNTNGVRFGYFLDALDAGATGVIRVKVGY
jgi:predicted RecA/RadA family phage recombinase